MDTIDKMEHAYVRERLATRFYTRYCQHNNLEQWPVPPRWAYSYADETLDVFDITDDVVARLAGDQ